MVKIISFLKERPKLIIISLCLFVCVLAFLCIRFHSAYVISEEKTKNIENKFELLSPTIAWMNTEDFLNKQKTLNVNYLPLKEKISEYLNKFPTEIYGFYFEDLTTGAWVGVNEKEEFMPRSLFKVPVMAAVLKKVEDGEISLNQSVFINQEDIDPQSGKLWENGTGYSITVKELLISMIQNSDNTALTALANHFLTDEDYLMAVSMMGLTNKPGVQLLTPKKYSNLLRSFYLSTYLKRPFSELALTIMLETEFNSQLPAKLPKDVKISHKVGVDLKQGFFHDCGIIYLPNHPYILCIMSKNNTQDRADEAISELSKMVYDYNLNLQK
jgi:beta-lactamase class A